MNYDKINENGIYFIKQFPTFEITVNFNDPLSTAIALSELTDKVEAECPVGKYFGESSIGEGIVWTPKEEGFAGWSIPELCFKSKGEKHKATDKKALRNVNAIDSDEQMRATSFVNYAVTENRLNQGLEYLTEQNLPHDIQHTKDFINWVVNDVFTEEIDTLIELKEPKGVKTIIASTAAQWYKNKIL